MKHKVVIGIAITTLLLIIVAFSGCTEDETTKSTETNILPPKTAPQPGVYNVSELSNLPMTTSLGNDTYLVFTDAGGCPAIAFDTKNFASFWIQSPICLSFSPDFELLDSLADKEKIHGYFENKGRYMSAFDLEVIVRDKNGKVVNKGVQEIRVQKEEELFLRRKVPVYAEIPLDFFETWEVRGSSIIT
jgi:hypothetical protein